VRKAAQFALNYTYYSTYYATRPGATSPVPVGMEGYNGDLAGLPYTDFELARSYLLESTYPEIVAGIAANNLDETSTDADWRAAAVSETPVYTANYTNYGGWYTFLNNYLQYVGIALDNNNVGDWPTFLSYMNDPENVAHSQFVMGGWCPDFFDPVNMLEPLFATTGSSNWNGLANETIDANLASLYTLPDGSEEKADMVDLCVTQIIVEQAAALYYMASADLIAWNKNPSTGIISGAECLLNVRGDKYFYPINFAPTKGAPYGEEFPEPTTSTGTVPGYNLGLFVIATLGASALLIFRKRK
jgi:ABC-type oligopeptide transport system substrate-binding subunit